MGSRVMQGAVPYRRDVKPLDSSSLREPVSKAENPEAVGSFVNTPRPMRRVLRPDRQLPGSARSALDIARMADQIAKQKAQISSEVTRQRARIAAGLSPRMSGNSAQEAHRAKLERAGARFAASKARHDAARMALERLDSADHLDSPPARARTKRASPEALSKATRALTNLGAPPAPDLSGKAQVEQYESSDSRLPVTPRPQLPIMRYVTTRGDQRAHPPIRQMNTTRRRHPLAGLQFAQAPATPNMPPLPNLTGQPVVAQTAPLRTPGAAAAKPEAETTSPVDLDQMIHLDLKDTDIKQFVKILSEQTKTNWLYNPNALGGKINMLGPQEMSLREAQYLLKSVLEFQGFTIERLGSLRRVIPRGEGKWRNTEMNFGPYKRPRGSALKEDRLITQLVRLKYRNVNDIRGILVNFAKDATAIIPYLPTNSLFITDNGTYIHRLMKIIKELDTPLATKQLAIIDLRYSFAKSIVAPLTQILGGSTPGTTTEGAPQEGVPPPPPPGPGGVPPASSKPIIIPDDADNRLFVIAFPSDLDYIREIVAELDRDPGHLPEIRVIPLKYSSPDSVKPLVEAAFKSDPGLAASIKNFTIIADKRTGSVLVTTYSPKMIDQVVSLIRTLDVPVVTAGTAIRVYRLEFAEAAKIAEVLTGLTEGDEDLAGAAPASSISSGVARILGQTVTSSAVETKAKKASIIADESTNALVIISTREKFNQIISVIKELDVVRPQVLVEVLIARIDVDRARHLGLDFNAVNAGGSSARPFAIGSTGNLAQLFGAGGARPGLNLGLLDKGDFDIGAAASGDISQLSKIGVLINILQNENRANILSAPKLLTADNEEAKITVGSQVRIPQGSTLNAINTITNFVTEDLGIILELTPRITKNDFVTMKIKTQIKNLIPGQDVAGIPVISNSDIETNVTVENRATIVMGGLIQEEEREIVNKLPLLGDIPLLGKLFRDTNMVKVKRNLLIFMTPHIIRTSTAAQAATKRVSPVLKHVGIKDAARIGNRADAATMLRVMNEAN